MEILFKNSYTRNRELAKEIYRFYYFQRKLLVFTYFLLAFSFLANIVCVAVGISYNIGILIFVPLFVAIQFYCYFHQVNIMVKRDNEVHGKEINVETTVTDSYIQNVASTGSVYQIGYDDIKNAVQTKNLILLRSKSNLIYIFDKNTFDIGTKEEFLLFLTSKGIKVRGK